MHEVSYTENSKSTGGEQVTDNEENEPSYGVIDLSDEDPDAAVSCLIELAHRRDADGWPQYILTTESQESTATARVERVLLGAVLESPSEGVTTQKFTDGFLFLLPAKDFKSEGRADADVAPLLGIKVSGSLGPGVIRRMEAMGDVHEWFGRVA